MTQPVLIEHAEAVPVPDFFPPEIRSRVAGKRIRVRTHRAMIDRLRAPEDMTVREWANRYREVASVEAISGPWREEEIPHTAEIMEAISLPWVREICLCMPERAGKTQVLINAAMWQIDRGIDAGNIFWLMPTEAEAKKAFGERLIPSLQATRRTRALLSRFRDDTTLSMVRFRHGVRIFPAWSNSPATIASFFGRLNIADETDKFADRAGAETDPLTLLRKRGRDRADSKFLFASTPGQKYIHTMTRACEQVWERRPRCPHCRDLVDFCEDHLVIPAGATEETVKNNGHAVGYACPACGTEWTEADRQLACRAGAWVAVKGADRPRPVSVGFHATAFAIDKIPLAEIAAAWLRAQTGDLAARIAWANGYLSRDHTAENIDRQEDAILRLRDDRPEGLVPSVPIAAITAIADMQKRGFWFRITAWGFGLDQESWLLRAGFVDSWEALRKLFYESEFQDVHKNRYVVTLRGIDSGGGESEEYADLSRTAEAYLFACANPGIMLFKGQRTMATPYSKSNRDRLPGSNKPLPGAVLFYNLNSRHYKNMLAAKLLVDPASPGAWHLHSGYTADQLDLLRRDPAVRPEHNLRDLARQMCAEGVDDKGFWVNPKRKDNHLWDCGYMELALIDIAQVKFWKQPDPHPAPNARRMLSNGV